MNEASNAIEIIENTPLSFAEYREKIMAAEERMRSLPGAMIGDSAPLKHTFAEGMYVREITMPPGYLAITKIHKYSHPAFILRGTVTIIEEEGRRTVTGPASFITKAGTKRIVFCHTEVVWTTVHATRETDIDKIEDEIVAKTFDELTPADRTIEIEGGQGEIS
jgi:hypothetical protein